jgi:flagellar biosynthesis protein FlhG
LIAALLAVAAAGNGQRVLLIDTDDLVGPASLLLGVSGAMPWQELRSSQRTANDVITPVSETLSLVAGGAAKGTDAIAISAAERRACMRRLLSASSRFDLVVIDCGSRLDALTASLTPHDGERLLAVTAGADPVTLASTYALVKAARLRHTSLPVEMIVNRQEEADALRSFDALDAGARQFLALTLTLAGVVAYDRTLDAALRAGMSFWDAAAGSPAAIAANEVVSRIMSPLSLPLSRSGL